MTMLEIHELMPSQGLWSNLKQQGRELINSGFLPNSIKTPEQFVAIVLKGRECGIPPMQSCQHINIIQGKPTMSAELMLSQILKHCPGTKIWYPIRSNEKCEIRVVRPGSKESTFEYSISDAKAAGLLGKDSWKKYPRAMLHARCVSEMARSLFPDAINGISYVPEEMGVEVNEDGEIVVPETTKTPSKELAPASDTISVDQTTPKDKPDNPAYSPPKFDTKNPEHLKAVQKFLSQQNTLDLMETFCRRLEGKPFTKDNVVAEYQLINPEAPDREPEDE